MTVVVVLPLGEVHVVERYQRHHINALEWDGAVDKVSQLLATVVPILVQMYQNDSMCII